MTTPLSQAGDDQANAKQVLRSRMRRARAAISQDAATHAARLAASHLLGIAELDGMTVAGLYVAFDHELGTREAADGLRARGIQVAYPRIAPPELVLRFHLVHGQDDLEPGPLFGIPQPAAHAEAVDVERLSMLIVPGLAFDEHGGRLGWGKGYYDATLAHDHSLGHSLGQSLGHSLGHSLGQNLGQSLRRRPLRVGYAYAFQLVPEVPQRSHDVSMDLVVTDAGVIRASEQARRPGSAPQTHGDEADVEEPA